MYKLPSAKADLACGALVFIVTLAAYARTLLPGAVGGDAGELQYAGPLLALVHPTGQPLYLLLGYLWSHLIPVGSVAYRMNLLAAASGAAACAVVAATLVRLRGSIWVGLSGGLALGFGATFWSQAVIADKYAFGALLAALLCGLALRWEAERETPGSGRLLCATCLAYGLCLLHHRSLFLLGPGLALLVLLVERGRLWRRPRRTLICLGLALAPAVAGYALFLPWAQSRGLSPLNWQPQTAAGWLDWWLERHILTGYALSFGASPSSSLVERLAFYAQTLWRDHTPVIPLVALIGAGTLLRRHRAAFIFLGLSFLLTAAFAANFRGNAQQFTIFYLPSFVVLIYTFGIGAGELANWGQRRWERLHVSQARHPLGHAEARRLGRSISFRTIRPFADVLPIRTVAGGPAQGDERALNVECARWDAQRVVLWAAAVALAVLLLVVPAYQFSQNYGPRRTDAAFGAPLDVWRQILKTGALGERLAAGMDDLPADAVVIGDWEQATILWYYQQVEGRRPDLEIVYPIERLADYLGGRRPVCLARSAPVGPEWRIGSVGALACLTQQPARTLPAGVTPIGAALYTPDKQPALELAAAHLAAPAYRPGSYAPLTLVWRAAGERRPDYQMSLHILDEQWRQLWAADSGPVLGIYPTSRWATGEVVQDYRELTIAPDLRPGRCLWTVVVYRQLADGSFEQLRDGQGNVEILGGTFEVGG
jgi:hypothetical protein